MANRSYLYSCDHLPGSDEWTRSKSLHGISEWRYDIPLVFRILLTGNPVACRSSIWDTPENIAIAGDYAQGRAHLSAYLARIKDPAARPLVDEALAFLNSPAHARRHFILECGEIFDLMDKGSPGEHNSTLLKEIRELAATLDFVQPPEPVKAGKGFLSALFWRKAPDPLRPYYDVGLGFWSDILYFDFTHTEA